MTVKQETPQKGFPWPILLALLLGIPGAFLAFQFSDAIFNPAPPLPIHGEVSDFELSEKGGAPINSDVLKGKPWIADFIFTFCGGQCPMMSTKMKGLQDQLPKDIRLVSFSVDPERDTQEILSSYAHGYGAEENRWLFLRGDMAVINQVAKSFHFSEIDEPLKHSLRFILVDEQSRIRGYYEASDENSMRKLVKDAKGLLK